MCGDMRSDVELCVDTCVCGKGFYFSFYFILGGSMCGNMCQDMYVPTRVWGHVYPPRHAYMVMPFIAVAYIVMAFIVMAYIVMVYPPRRAGRL